ncbi:pyridoxamine 5'-phosphate oxidase family protein [Dactylosporangium sp. CS-033363]|uniref:pyridoxamine 5'-phosphate oxidase family protein n=1 Tax=Dactylosporangium sp. CS-033363 TaxID=3239935 RepID=UPI003D8C3454
MLDSRYSEPGATEVPWETVRERFAGAGVYWLTTVRDEGRPHVTPLIGVWLDEAFWFTTGAEEQKRRNLHGNAAVAVTTGTDALHEGLDVVVQGDAAQVEDQGTLERAAQAWLAKYGEEWHFEARDGGFHHVQGGQRADVFRVTPLAVHAFGKDPYSQNRYTF